MDQVVDIAAEVIIRADGDEDNSISFDEFTSAVEAGVLKLQNTDGDAEGGDGGDAPATISEVLEDAVDDAVETEEIFAEAVAADEEEQQAAAATSETEPAAAEPAAAAEPEPESAEPAAAAAAEEPPKWDGPTVKVVFCRHGESEWNALNQFCGWFDAALSEHGKAEAKAGGVALKAQGYEFDACHSSVLQRANTTAAIILEELGATESVPIAKTWRLNERHYGGLTGLNKAETAEKYGEDQVKIWRR